MSEGEGESPHSKGHCTRRPLFACRVSFSSVVVGTRPSRNAMGFKGSAGVFADSIRVPDARGGGNAISVPLLISGRRPVAARTSKKKAKQRKA